MNPRVYQKEESRRDKQMNVEAFLFQNALTSLQ